MSNFWNILESKIGYLSSNVKLIEKALLGLEGSYVELLTILCLGLLAVFPIIIPNKKRQILRHVNQILGIGVFIFVVFTCLGVFGMVRNFIRGLNEIGRENIIALYYCSVPATIVITSIIFGPAFCGWICPTGALQEFTGMLTRRFNVKNKMLGYPFSKTKLIMSIMVLVVFLLWMYRLSVTRMFFIEDASIYWSEILIILLFILVFKIRDWDIKLRRLRILSFLIILTSAFVSLRITSPVHFGYAKIYDPASFLSTVIVILSALVIPQVWCKYLCPWRCVISWAGKKSVRKINFDNTKCIECNKCTKVCYVDAVEKGKINQEECHFCFRCVDNCPTKCFNVKDEWKEG